MRAGLLDKSRLFNLGSGKSIGEVGFYLQRQHTDFGDVFR